MRVCGTTNTKAQGLDRRALMAIPELIVRPHPFEPGHYFLQGFTYDRHVQWAQTRDGLLQQPPTNDPDILTQAITDPVVVVEPDVPCTA